MIILYWKDAPQIYDCTFLSCAIGHTIIEQSGKLYLPDVDEPIVNDSSKVGWFVAPEQYILPEQIEEVDEVEKPAKRTVGELNLTYFTPETLPRSTHIAVLTGVDVHNKIATVARKFMGELYDIPGCEPTDYIVKEYQEQRLHIGDKVMVAFVEEYPVDELLVFPVIFAKRS